MKKRKFVEPVVEKAPEKVLLRFSEKLIDFLTDAKKTYGPRDVLVEVEKGLTVINDLLFSIDGNVFTLFCNPDTVPEYPSKPELCTVKEKTVFNFASYLIDFLVDAEKTHGKRDIFVEVEGELKDINDLKFSVNGDSFVLFANPDAKKVVCEEKEECCCGCGAECVPCCDEECPKETAEIPDVDTSCDDEVKEDVCEEKEVSDDVVADEAPVDAPVDETPVDETVDETVADEAPVADSKCDEGDADAEDAADDAVTDDACDKDTAEDTADTDADVDADADAETEDAAKADEE